MLTAVRKKCQATYKGKPIRGTADFTTEILKSRKTWNDTFQGLEENNCQPILLYPANLSFRIKGKIIFHD
jgi:hypothetical protein